MLISPSHCLHIPMLSARLRVFPSIIVPYSMSLSCLLLLHMSSLLHPLWPYSLPHHALSLLSNPLILISPSLSLPSIITPQAGKGLGWRAPAKQPDRRDALRNPTQTQVDSAKRLSQGEQSIHCFDMLCCCCPVLLLCCVAICCPVLCRVVVRYIVRMNEQPMFAYRKATQTAAVRLTAECRIGRCNQGT